MKSAASVTGNRTNRTRGFDALRARFLRMSPSVLIENLFLEDGCLDDYVSLSSFHYRPGKPGTVISVYRYVHRAPTVVGRFLQRGNQETLAGVLTLSMPHAGCVMRDYATTQRYRGIDLTAGMIMLNREFRTISRVIIHPNYRGLGLAVNLVRHVLDNAKTVFTEALAVMGKAHPFFERAGMIRYDRPIRPEHARLHDALDRIGVEPSMLAARDDMAKRIGALSEADRRWIERELRQWHRATCMKRSHPTDRVSLGELFLAARDQLLVRPVYYLWRRGGEKVTSECALAHMTQ